MQGLGHGVRSLGDVSLHTRESAHSTTFVLRRSFAASSSANDGATKKQRRTDEGNYRALHQKWASSLVDQTGVIRRIPAIRCAAKRAVDLTARGYYSGGIDPSIEFNKQ